MTAQHAQVQPDRATAQSTARGCFFRFNGLALILSSLAVATIGWFVLGLLADSLSKDSDLSRHVAPSAKWLIDHRAWLPIMAIPSIVGGALLVKTRTRSAFWLVLIITSLWIFALFGLILYSFVMFMKPLYEYHPL